MSDNRPLGIYDSGIGGLTVAAEVKRQLPRERIVYFGDTARLPYGSKSPEEILTYSRQIISFLLSKNCKFIIVACNTSSALALPIVRGEFDVPMIGMITPGVEAALRLTKNGAIGVLATPATARSMAFEAAVDSKPGLKVRAVGCPALVPLVESGMGSSREAREALEEYIAPLAKFGMDVLVLGCTHYPYLVPLIRDIVGPSVAIIDPSREVVSRAADWMAAEGLLHDGGPDGLEEPNVGDEFYVSGDPREFVKRGSAIAGWTIEEARQVDVTRFWPAGGRE